jgi:hypothetical protein
MKKENKHQGCTPNFTEVGTNKKKPNIKNALPISPKLGQEKEKETSRMHSHLQ